MIYSEYRGFSIVLTEPIIWYLKIGVFALKFLQTVAYFRGNAYLCEKNGR